jgi:hypothetical protein
MARIYSKGLSTFLLADLLMESKIAFAKWIEPFRDTISPDDALSVASDGIDAASTLLWAGRGIAVVASTILIGMCARRIHREDYYGALITFIGAIIAGASPYLSTVLFLG